MIETFKCLDCGSDTSVQGGLCEYYMVYDHLWLAANPKRSGMLCIGCLEERLGIKFKPSDFTDCPLNQPTDMARKSDRLRERLGISKEK